MKKTSENNIYKNKEIMLAENFEKHLQDWKLPEISSVIHPMKKRKK